MPEHRFDAVRVGEEFGPRTLVVDERRVKDFAYCQDDFHEWHFGGSPFGPPVAHASLLANELMQIYFERYRIDAHEDGSGAWLEEAHVEEALWFASPLPVGETVELRGRFSDKYVVGGRGAVVLEGEAVGEDGRTIIRHRAVEYFRMDGPRPDDERRREPPLRRVERLPAAAGAPRRPAGAHRPGTPIEPLRKRVSFPQMLVFATLEAYPSAHRSVHTDFAIAARAGLAGPLVQGQQLACFLAEAASRFFGASWFTSGWLRAKFLAAVLAGQTIRVCGAVHGRGRDAAGADLVELDLWIEDEEGGLVAVANAAAAPS